MAAMRHTLVLSVSLSHRITLPRAQIHLHRFSRISRRQYSRQPRVFSGATKIRWAREMAMDF